MDDITALHCKNIILGGDFNIFFNLTFEARGGNAKIKNKSVAKFIDIKESLRIYDVWRVRNPKKKRYTSRQQYVTGFINKMDILTALSTDHSPIFFSLSINVDISRDKGLWKFNSSLCHKPNFVTELKNYLKVICNRMSAEQITGEQLCCEYINLN